MLFLDDGDGAIDGAAHAACQPHDVALAVADGGDAVQGAGDAGAVVGVELADLLDHVLDLACRDLRLAQHHLAVRVAGSGHAPQVEDHLQQVVAPPDCLHGGADVGGKDGHEGVQVVCDVIVQGITHHRKGESPSCKK